MMLRRLAIFLGLLLILFLPFWFFSWLPLLTALPTNFSLQSVTSHKENNRFSIGGDWSGETIAIGNIAINVIKNETRKAYIESKFSVVAINGETLFSLPQKFVVDRRTLRNYPSETDINGDAYFLFPKHVQKKSYLWWPPSFGEPFDLTFVDTVKYGGLITYHFRGERTDINDTLGYDFLPSVPEKYLALSRAALDVYVEPFSGTIIDYKDSGTSYFATMDKKPIWDISRWGNSFNDELIKSRITMAEEGRNRLFFLEVFIPLFVLTIGVLLIYLGESAFLKHKAKKR